MGMTCLRSEPVLDYEIIEISDAQSKGSARLSVTALGLRWAHRVVADH